MHHFLFTAFLIIALRQNRTYDGASIFSMATPHAGVGGTLGRYQLLEQIGAGGMGVIFRAHDRRLSRDVAIKLLSPGSFRSVVARHRVRNEAIALSRLSHPNIETIFEFDSQEECDFLVVELIAGESMDQLVSRGPIPQDLSLSLAVQLLQGLTAAHEKGIIHRDLKPSNLRLTSDGFLKILDFGIAQLGDDALVVQDLTTETHSGVLAGTLRYMAPEQLRGAPPDPRSDLYSAGLILYQMCTGGLPFSGSGATLIDAILNRPVPLPSKVAKLSPTLEAVILKALARDPNQRYQSAREMLRDLERLKAGVPRAKIARWVPALAAVLFGLVALAAITQRTQISNWIERFLHPVPSYKYVAVMPFRSISNDDPVFDQGLTESIAVKLMELTSAQPVQVVSPRELVAEHVTDVADARRKLGVNLAIEGTLQQVKDKVRVALELVDTSNRRLLRAADLPAGSSDPLVIQDQVIEKTVQMLEIEIHKNIGEQDHGTTNPEAYRLYIRGRGFSQDAKSPEDTQSAIEQFRQALDIDPGYAEAHASLGSTYLLQYQLERKASLVDSSRSECEQASNLAPRLQSAKVCLGEVQLALGANEQAASMFQDAVSADPKDDGAYRNLALAYERLGRFSLAEDTYRKAISVRPQYANGYVRLGLFLSHQAKYDQAAAELRQAVQLSPDDRRPWSSLGGVYYLAGKYDEAITALLRSIALRPTFAAYTNLGHSYFALGKYEDAIAAFEQAVTLGGSQVQAHGNLARAYYWYLPKRPLAAAEYRKALDLVENDLKVNPTDPDTHLLAAQYHAMLGHRKEALDQLDFAIRARPNDAETLYFAAIVHIQLGDKPAALSWLKKAMAAGYSPTEIARTPEFGPLKTEASYESLVK